MAELPRPLPPPSWRDRFESVGFASNKLPAPVIVAVVAAAIVAAVVVTAIATGKTGSWQSGGGADVALSLPQASTTTSLAADQADGAVVATGPLHVHAAGAVAHPGMVEVPAGARVSDVVTAAGGAAPDADLDQINLAQPVKDGERVYVPRHGESVPALAAAGSPSGGGSEQASAIVNINEADQAGLESLPGVGPATAKAILDYRTQHGKFHSVDDLLNVRGIGPAKLEQIKPFARV